jgi:hypothetical protein
LATFGHFLTKILILLYVKNKKNKSFIVKKVGFWPKRSKSTYLRGFSVAIFQKKVANWPKKVTKMQI